MSDALKYVTEAKVVHVQPGDVIWLKVDRGVRLSSAIAEQIRNHAKEIWPDNEIVVGVDIDVEIVRPGAKDAA